MRSVYSLVLSDEVIGKIDELAFKKGVSRSQFINDLLAESVGVDTERKRIQDIFDEVADYVDGFSNMRVQKRQQSAFDFLSALNYKYSPRVTYSVDLFGGDRLSGELKIALRTTNPVLISITESFFNDFIEVEKTLGSGADYSVRDGKLVRKLDFSSAVERGKSVSVAITDYVRSLDLLFNLYVDSFGDGEKVMLYENYKKVKDKMCI